MKLIIATLLVASAAAFAPTAQPSFGVKALHAIGDKKAAKSAAEDLDLTREVILAFMGTEEEPAEEPKESKKKSKKSKKEKKE